MGAKPEAPGAVRADNLMGIGHPETLQEDSGTQGAVAPEGLSPSSHCTHWFARDAIAKYHGLGGLNHTSGGQKSEINVSARLISSEASLLGL